MDFNYTVEQQEFRTRLRTWLEATSAEIFGADDCRGRGSLETRFFGLDDRHWSQALEYHRRLYRARYPAR